MTKGIPEVVIVSGSREWTDPFPIEECLRTHRPGTILIHGGCRGADRTCAIIAKRFKFVVWELPYFEDPVTGKEARNESMVAVALALRAKRHKVTGYVFPLSSSVGTWKAYHLMRDAGIPVPNWSNERRGGAAK